MSSLRPIRWIDLEAEGLYTDLRVVGAPPRISHLIAETEPPIRRTLCGIDRDADTDLRVVNADVVCRSCLRYLNAYRRLRAFSDQEVENG